MISRACGNPDNIVGQNALTGQPSQTYILKYFKKINQNTCARHIGNQKVYTFMKRDTFMKRV